MFVSSFMFVGVSKKGHVKNYFLDMFLYEAAIRVTGTDSV